MDRKLMQDLIRHHVLDALAWLWQPDWNNAALHVGRSSLHQLRQLLKISVADVRERQRKLGIREEDRA